MMIDLVIFSKENELQAWHHHQSTQPLLQRVFQLLVGFSILS
jgi:hypothetical protein